jgi:ketosteroid isomerase-like protein
MSTELEDEIRQLFDEFDRLDFDAVAARMSDGVQGVDELSRRWMRGRDDITAYFEQMQPLLSDVQSNLSDVKAVSWGETGVVTCWLEQTYELEGKSDRISAPTTFVLRREGGAWKVVLLHSIPVTDSA